MSIFLVESCHVDQMTVHGGGGWGELRLEDLLKEEVNFGCCRGEFA
jgi:hypothetical protein